MKNFTRRALLLGSGAALGVAGTKYLKSSNPVLDGTKTLQPGWGEDSLNDASELSQTPIHKHIILKDDPGQALVKALRAELKDAAADNRPVNIGAARHSMGAQAIPRDGHAITFDNGLVETDTAKATYRAHAGARWAQVIAAIDPQGFSPAVMQSNHDFGVAATFCVNAHGWPVPYGPMGATVQNFKMLLADGELVACSRHQNTDLFNLTMGGYGLTGLITEMQVDMVPNQRLEPTFKKLPGEQLGTAFMQALSDKSVTMAYGRLNVDRENFMHDALMITYRAAADQSDLPPASGSGFMSKVAGKIYRAQLGNERMKRVRWFTETDLGPRLAGASTRNSLINEPVVTLDDGNPNRVDILHEYFVAPERFPEFLQVCRDVIPASYQEFLNVTLRFINTDSESLLAYAAVPRIAAVMSFSQELTARAEADMARMTHALIDGIIGIGGSYYLPYRPHASLDQLLRAYPRAAKFAAAKRAIDPDLRFRNNLWDTYLGAL
ncbi:MAG: FAD-binding protein [Paracoccaceae bacterium]